MPEKISRPVQISLGVFLLTVLIFVVMSQQGVPVTSTESSTAVDTKTGKTLTPMDAQKQFLLIQNQVKSGTLSQEDAKQQIAVLSSQVLPPPLPPEAKNRTL